MKTRTENAKLDYLYAFEALFGQKCRQANIKASKWQQGMWTNAHMSYCMGASLEGGVDKWFAHVQSVEKPRSYSPFEDSMELHESFAK